MNFKPVIFFAILCISLNHAFSQASYPMDKGAFKLGGGISLRNSNWDDPDGGEHSFSFYPTAQYFIIPGLAVGGGLNFFYYFSRGNTNNNFRLGPTVSYYFGDEENKFLPFISTSYLFSTRLNRNFNTISHTSNFSLGGAYMIVRNIAIEGKLDLQLFKIRFGSGDVQNIKTLELSFGVDLFIFGKAED